MSWFDSTIDLFVCFTTFELIICIHFIQSADKDHYSRILPQGSYRYKLSFHSNRHNE